MYVFVGEKRSNTAIDKGWTWDTCKEFPQLCAIQLFGALRFAGIDPGKQIFVNLWQDDGRLKKYLKYTLEVSTFPVVGMGNKVCTQLNKWGIKHIKIVHPAARGIWRRKEVYNRHIKKRLGG